MIPSPIQRFLSVLSLTLALLPSPVLGARGPVPAASGENASAGESPSTASAAGAKAAAGAPAKEKPPVGAPVCRIVDKDGKPLAGVRVSVQQKSLVVLPETTHETTPTLTDAHGAFEFPANIPVKSLIVFSKDGYATSAYPSDARFPEQIELAPEEKISGCVLDERGVSLSQALIGPVYSISNQGLAAQQSQPAIFVRSDAQGNFEIRGLARGKYEYMVQSAQGCPQMDMTISGAVRRIQLSSAGTTVTGTVVGSRDGAPKPDLYVEAVSARLRVYAKSDAQGHFVLPCLSQREWTLRVAQEKEDEPLRHPGTEVSLAGKPGEREVRLVQNQGVQVAGQVMDADSSTPLAGFALRLDGEKPRSVQTDSNGRFSFDNLDGFGEVSLRFDSTRYACESERFGALDYYTVPPLNGEDCTTLTMALRQKVFVRGKVMDPYGAIVPEADVQIRALEASSGTRVGKYSSRPIYNARTGKNGEFQCSVFPGGAFEVSAQAGLMMSDAQRTEAYTTSPASLTLKLRSGVILLGRVTDASDQIVTGAAVAVYPADAQPEAIASNPAPGGAGAAAAKQEAGPNGAPGGEVAGKEGGARPLKTGKSDAKGEFKLEGVPTRQVVVAATHPQFAQPALMTIDPASASSAPLVLRFPAGQDFIARVVNEGGTPIPGIEVSLYYNEGIMGKALATRSEHDGVVAVRSLSVNQLDRIVASDPGYVAFEEQNVTLPRTDYVIKMLRRGSISVTIQDQTAPPAPETGDGAKTAAARELEVWLFYADFQGNKDATTAPPADRFLAKQQNRVTGNQTEFADVDPGWYKAAVRRGGLYSESEPVKCTGSGKAEITVSLVPGTTVHGKVTDKTTHQGIAGVVLSLKPAVHLPTQPEPVSTVTRADGTFSVADVPAGTMGLSTYHASYPQQVQEITVPAGRDMELDITLSSELAKLTGNVRFAGAPLASALVIAYDASATDKPVASAVSDEQGKYELSGLVPGTAYTITAEAALSDSEELSHKSYEVKLDQAGKTLDIEFDRLTRVTGSVKVNGQRAKPEDGARNLLFMRKSGGGEGKNVAIQEDGSFSVDLEPSLYSVGLEDRPGRDVTVPKSDTPYRIELSF